MDEGFQSLLARLASLRASDSGGFTLKSVTWAGDDLDLGVEVSELDWIDGRSHEVRAEDWQIHCRDVRESRIGALPVRGGIYIEARHTVLLPYTSPVAEVYFRGSCPDPDRVVGQLWEAHNSVVGEWFPFRRFLGVWPLPAALLRGGFGMLAAGPQELMDRYAGVLRQNGLHVSSPPPTPPKGGTWEKRGKYVTEPEPPKVLFVDRCFVITPQVTAKRL